MCVVAGFPACFSYLKDSYGTLFPCDRVDNPVLISRCELLRFAELIEATDNTR
jgi:hypothetical protein